MIQLTENRGNWDLYLTDSGYIESVATAEGCGDAVYGSVSHFMKNLKLGYIEVESLTEYGRKFAKEEAERMKYIIEGL